LDKDEAIVGWVGHVGTRSSDLETLKGVLGPWLKRNSGSFFHGGANSSLQSAAPRLGLDGDVPVFTMPMQPIQLYPRFFRRFNLGIVPLSSAPFNSAKSEIKGVEYSAAGLPFVAAATPSYRSLANNLGVGVVAEKAKHWLAAFDRFRDKNERIVEGERNRALIEQHYNISGNAQLPYLEFYGSLR